MEEFSLEKSLFSPNFDGIDDVLVMSYSLSKPGYTVRIQVYDVLGYPVRRLANSLILSSEGFLIWDGLNEDLLLAPVGIYIIYIQAFHPE